MYIVIRKISEYHQNILILQDVNIRLVRLNITVSLNIEHMKNCAYSLNDFNYLRISYNECVISLNIFFKRLIIIP